jgi:hypothetical protein
MDGDSDHELAYLWIPNFRIWDRPVFNRLQQDWLRPGPPTDDAKEFAQDDRANSFWVQLANSRNKHGPCHTTREAHDVRIDSTS